MGARRNKVRKADLDARALRLREERQNLGMENLRLRSEAQRQQSRVTSLSDREHQMRAEEQRIYKERRSLEDEQYRLRVDRRSIVDERLEMSQREAKLRGECERLRQEKDSFAALVKSLSAEVERLRVECEHVHDGENQQTEMTDDDEEGKCEELLPAVGLARVRRSNFLDDFVAHCYLDNDDCSVFSDPAGGEGKAIGSRVSAAPAHHLDDFSLQLLDDGAAAMGDAPYEPYSEGHYGFDVYDDDFPYEGDSEWSLDAASKVNRE